MTMTCKYAFPGGWCACHWRSPEEARETMALFASIILPSDPIDDEDWGDDDDEDWTAE